MDTPNIRFTNPNAKNFPDNIMFASALCLPELESGTESGSVVIAGSGPSLKDEAVLADIQRELHDGAKLFACKAAVKYLHEAGFHIDYSANIDPGQHIPQRIAKVPECTYFIASSSDPVTFKHLLEEPRNDVRVFHSACGLENEEELYRQLFKNSDCMMGGYNIVNRAYAIAMHMGFDRFVFAGLDSGWRDDQNFYVTDDDVLQKKVYMNDKGEIDGKMWHSTPDMLASAVAFAKLARKYDSRNESDKFVFLGDVLPKALREKDDDYLNRVARLEKG